MLLGRTLSRLLVPIVVGGLALALTTLAVGPQVRDLVTAGEAGEVAVDLAPLAERSVVYAADGSVLAVFADQNRSEIPLAEVPDHVVRAVLDAEDDRFFEHGALDWRALLRALATNLESGEVVEGGSTITQQLVKNSLLTPARDLERKIQEASLAVRLERQMTKDEILERYLNTVYFGNSAYGIQAAAEVYYGVDAAALTLSQGVLLASLIRNPSGGDPWVDPDAARARRDVVIDRMRLLGHLDDAEAAALVAEPLPQAPAERPARGTDYFVEAVRRSLLDDPRLGADRAERERKLLRGGLRIYTTIDPALQRVAEAKVAEILPDSGGRFTAALVTLDPGTGAVRALVGGPDFTKEKFNLVTQGGRQTGSLFKALTLVAALEEGYQTGDRILGSSPCRIPNPGGAPDPWEVKNAGSSFGAITLTEATANSVNCAYARLVKLVGAEKVVEVAHRMGITQPLVPNLSLALGTASVSPLEMATVFATIADDGQRRTPHFVERIEDRDGALVLGPDDGAVQAIEPGVARRAAGVLTEVVKRGTGTAARVPGWQVIGKTGSTDDNTDAWFAGSTRGLTTVVWMGAPEGRVEMANVGGIRVYGGTYPARIFGAYMGEALADRAPVAFPPPPSRVERQPRFLRIEGERAPAPEQGAEGKPPEGVGEPATSGVPTTTPGEGPPHSSKPGGTRPDISLPPIEPPTVPPRPTPPPRPTFPSG